VAGAIAASPAAARTRQPTLYLDVRGIKEPPKAKPSLKDLARDLLGKELSKHKTVVTTLGDPEPTGAALAKALKKRGLIGYGIILRITKVDHSIHPPAKGSAYKVLMVEVSVAVDAEKIPSGQMALAGSGTTPVGTEVSRFRKKERDQLIREALAGAIKEAVARSVAKLSPSKQKPRRRSRRRQ
jgi:hypothetical protein